MRQSRNSALIKVGSKQPTVTELFPIAGALDVSLAEFSRRVEE